MREITSHRTTGLNDALSIVVLDEPGSGNACHLYKINLPFDSDPVDITTSGNGFVVRFQNGPIAEAGVNGISNEVLLAIVEDRLSCFESGPYACSENAEALRNVKEALFWLQKRTQNRIERGVEGTAIV